MGGRQQGVGAPGGGVVAAGQRRAQQQRVDPVRAAWLLQGGRPASSTTTTSWLIAVDPAAVDQADKAYKAMEAEFAAVLAGGE